MIKLLNRIIATQLLAVVILRAIRRSRSPGPAISYYDGETWTPIGRLLEP